MTLTTHRLPMPAHYDYDLCATHRITLFGSYFDADGAFIYGCLKCHWEDDTWETRLEEFVTGDCHHDDVSKLRSRWDA